MGAVTSGVVEATFFNFHPGMVRRAIPDAWTFTTPEAVVSARSVAAAAAIRRIAPHADDHSRVLLPLLTQAVERGRGAGRPLFAANRDTPPAADGLARAWQAATALREHRGDGHVAVLTEAGLDGCEAHVLYVATTGVDAEVLRANRGWSHTKWADAIERLRDRGLGDRLGRGHRSADTRCATRSSSAPTSSRCSRSHRSRPTTSTTSSASRSASPGPLPRPARSRTRIRWDSPARMRTVRERTRFSPHDRSGTSSGASRNAAHEPAPFGHRPDRQGTRDLAPRDARARPPGPRRADRDRARDRARARIRPRRRDGAPRARTRWNGVRPARVRWRPRAASSWPSSRTTSWSARAGATR